jgi:aryl-alcohol dehydrogenase-like predicted oxidoreductase
MTGQEDTTMPSSSARRILVVGATGTIGRQVVNQHKLDAVEKLAQLAEQTGMTLIEMAVAFVLRHPGVTSAIIGPRTMEQLEAFLPAADITLTTEVLDRIDAIVAPGVTVNPADNSYGDHELRPEQRRRP